MPDAPTPIDVRLRSEQTKGRLAVIENRVAADFAGPPLHVHPDFDEVFYVLEGELTFQLGDDVFTRQAGELAFAPRGVPHTYTNRSGAPARFVLVCTPAGFERYFARLAAQLGGAALPPEASGPIPEVRVVGPRIPR